MALLLGFIVGEGVSPSRPSEWLGFLLFPVGISVGMILAWRNESLGGGITVGCLVAFYAVHLMTAAAFPRGWAWPVFAGPGFLFLLLSRLSRRPKVATV